MSFVTKLEKILALQQFLLGDISGDFGAPNHMLALFHVALPRTPAAERSRNGSVRRALFEQSNRRPDR